MPLFLFFIRVADDLEILVLVLVVAFPVLFAPLLAARVHHLATGIGGFILQVLSTEDEVILGLFAVTLVKVVMGWGFGDAVALVIDGAPQQVLQLS